MKVKELFDRVDKENILHSLIQLQGGSNEVRQKYLFYFDYIKDAPDEIGEYNLLIEAVTNGVLDYKFFEGWMEVSQYIDTIPWIKLANCYLETDLNINDTLVLDRIVFFIISEATKFGEVFKNGYKDGKAVLQ
jgi:hypothetical protein